MSLETIFSRLLCKGVEGMAEHFGLPSDRNTIFLLIATVPVILDAMKYWIFNYPTRKSPSAVAVYKTMNE